MHAALLDFRKAIGDVRKIADWLDSQALYALANDLLPATNAIQCGCIVLLSGHFESFLSDVINAFIREVNHLEKPFSILPENIRHQHFVDGGRALNALAREERKLTPNNTARSEYMAQRLASVSSDPPYSLVWEAFSDTRANPGWEVVRDLLKAFEIEDPWRKMDPFCANRAEYLRTWLGTFVELRNECAHNGYATAPPGNSDLRDYASNMELIGSAIVQLLQNRLTELAAL